MSLKRKIKASEIVRDIRAGMTNYDLMEKYGLLFEQLLSLFAKLIDAKLLSHAELAFHIPSSGGTVFGPEVRQSSRCYPPVPLRVYDLDDLTSELAVKDLSQEGIHVVGIRSTIGRRVSFLIQAIELPDVDPLTFDAECRWVRTETDESGRATHDAGFVITDIDNFAREQLAKIIAKFPDSQD